MPDSSIMLELCNELKISVNELLCGELIEMKDYNEIAEKNLLEMAKKEEVQNKKMMFYEICHWIYFKCNIFNFIVYGIICS